MNHDITHCTGVKGDTVCEGCHRKMHSYLNAEDCVEMEHNMLWVE